MSALSDSLENLLLQHILANTTWTSPTTVYLALYTSATSDSAPGTEVTGSGYARQSITFGSPSSGTIANTNTVTFTVPAATITHCAIWSHVSSTTTTYYLLHVALSASITTTTGQSISFAAGDITVSLA